MVTAGLLSEALEILLTNATYSNLKRRPAILMEGEMSKRGAPDEGIMLVDEEIDLDRGSDCYGNIIFESQPCIIEAWSTNRIDRKHLKDDIVYILNNSTLNIYFLSIRPATMIIDKFGWEIRIGRKI